MLIVIWWKSWGFKKLLLLLKVQITCHWWSIIRDCSFENWIVAVVRLVKISKTFCKKICLRVVLWFAERKGSIRGVNPEIFHRFIWTLIVNWVLEKVLFWILEDIWDILVEHGSPISHMNAFWEKKVTLNTTRLFFWY